LSYGEEDERKAVQVASELSVAELSESVTAESSPEACPHYYKRVE
jgi:hypothetical protein